MRADLILILSLLLISFICILAFRACSSEGAFVRVTVDGDTVGYYPLSEDGEYSLNGGTNVLIIKDGAAWIDEADCPDKLCISQGKISASGERIICLPNKIEVSIVGESETDLQP